VRYTHAGNIDEPLAEMRNTTAGYYEQDGIGSVTSLTTFAAGLVDSYGYDAFGNITASTNGLINSFQYTGRDYDAETGLRYYRARYYEPQSGRFLSEDPLGFGAGDNFYPYVLNNPTNLRDPSGRSAGSAALPAVGGTAATICFGTGVCETVIVVGGTVVAVGGVLYILSQSKPVSKTPDWARPNCGDACAKILAQIYSLMGVIKVRYYEMMTDPWDLYNKAYHMPTPTLPGTWLGHESAFVGAQVGLTRAIAEATAIGCQVPQEAYWLATLPVPSEPGWKGYKP